MHIRMHSRGRSNLLVSHGGLRGAGKNIRKWNSFLRWGSAPNPVVVSIRRRRQCRRLVVLVVGFWLVGLVYGFAGWLGLWFGWFWFLVGWSFGVISIAHWILVSWPEF